MQNEHWSAGLNGSVLANLISEGFLVVDSAQHIIYANPAFSTMISRSIAELVGKRVTEFIETGQEEPLAELLLTSSGRERSGTVLSWRTASGETVRTTVVAGVFDSPKQNGQWIFLITSELEGERQIIDDDEGHFSRLMDLYPDGIVTLDKRGNITYCNRAIVEYTGYSVEELVGRRFTLLGALKASDIPTYLQMFTSIVRGITPEPIQVEWEKKDGSTFTAEVISSPLRKNGNVTGVIAIARDVTKWTKAEIALRESEEKFRLLYENLPDGIFRTNEDGIITMCSPKGAEIAGYDIDEIIGMHFIQLVHPDDRPAVLEQYQESKAKGTAMPRGIEARGVRKDGSVIHFHVTNTLLMENGVAKGLQSLIRDVTERRNAEETQRASEERYRTIIQSLEDIVFVYDGENRYSQIYTSDRGLVLRPPEELVGKTVDEVLPLEVADVHRSCFARVRETGEGENIEYQLEIGGIPYWFSATVTMHEDGLSVVSLVRNITEKKETERELRENEERFALFAENIPGPVYIKDENSNYVYANTFMKERFRVEEWQGKHTLDIFPNEYGQIMVEEDKITLREGSTHRLQAVPDLNGTMHWYQTSKFSIRREGKPTLIGGVALDVTDRIEAEKAIQASEKKYRQLHESLEDGYTSTDMEGRYLEVNRAYLEISGYTEEELKSRTFWDLTPPQWHEMEKRIQKDQTMIRGFSDLYEKELLRKDGTAIPVEIRVYLLRDDDGKPIGTWALVRDISLRKKAEEELRSERDTAQMYLDIADAAIVVVDVDGRIHLMNRKGLEIIGYSAVEVLGRNWIELGVPERLREQESNAFHQALASAIGSEEDYLLPVLTKTGEERLVSWRFQVLKNDAGEAIGLIASGEDVTERNRAESALKESEEQYRSILWALSDAIHVVDENLNIILVNPRLGSWVKELNLGDNITGMKLPEAFPFLTDSVFEEYREVFQTGEILTSEEKTLLGDREIITEATKIPITREERVAQVVTIIRDITSRVEAEQAIKDSEEKYKQLVEQYTQGVAILQGPPLDIVFANSALGKMVGMTPEELIALLPEEVETMIHPDDYDETLGRFGELLGGREAYDDNFSIRIIRPSGEIRQIEVLGRRVDYEGGYAIQAAMEDITERVRAVEELRESEERYRKLVEESLQGFAVIQDGRYVYANSSFAKTLGNSVEEILQFSPEEVWENVYPDDRPELLRRNEDIEAGRSISPRHRFRYFRKDGSIRWVESFVGKVDYRGRPALQVLDVDITGRMESEQALRDSEAKYRHLVEQAQLGIIIVQGLPIRIVFANNALSKITGRSQEELLALSTQEIENLIHPEDYESLMQSFADILEGQAQPESPIMLRVTRSDGKVVWVEVLGQRVDYQEDVAIQATVLDVTERVIAERDRQKAEEETKAAAETAMLYLDLLGHDMRNNLQAIQMAIELFQFGESRPDLYPSVEKVIDLIKSSEALIDKAHATRGLLAAPLTSASLLQPLRNCLKEIENRFEDVIIDADYGVDDAIVKADEYLEHLLLNVLENAVIHNDSEQKQVWVTLSERRGGFEIAIADNGNGINDSIKKTLFTQDRRFGGLGLHQAKSIISKYGGTIEVSDRVPGKFDMGTKFQLWFPKV
ncbi:MAG: PAS domain S-box protein [Promethearchaeota archaeon]